MKNAEHVTIPRGTVIIVNGERFVMTEDQSFFPSSPTEGVRATQEGVDTILEQRDELMACLETYDGVDASEWWRNQRDAILAKLKNN